MGSFAPSFFHNDVADLFISLNVKGLLNMSENLVFRAGISFMEDIMDSSIFSYIVFNIPRAPFSHVLVFVCMYMCRTNNQSFMFNKCSSFKT